MMRRITRGIPVVLLALLVLAGLLLPGCGSGSGSTSGSGAGVGMGGVAQTATVVLQSSLATRDARTPIPADVTHIRVSGMDRTGSVLYGPVVHPKAATITLLEVPVAVTFLQLDYLSMGADGLLTGTSRQGVTLLPGTTLVIQDPPITAVSVTAVAVSPSAVTLIGGAKRQFLATASLSNRTAQDVTRLATWTSSDPTVALVSLFGLAETQKVGQVDISAEISGVRARGVLTVTPAVATDLRITPPDSRLAVGWVADLHALATLSDQTQVDLTQTAQWSSSNPAVATVDQGGHVSGVAPGPVTIRAISGALSATATLTITTSTITAIEVQNPQADQPLVVGQQLQLEAVGVFSDGSTVDVTDEVLWTSTTPGVATIDASGVALAVGAGETEITASLGVVTSAPSPLVVEAEIVNIIISPNNPTMQVGGQQRFTATGIHADGSESDVTGQVTWVSSDPTLASFGGSGLLTAHAAGTVFVRAVLGSEDGRTEVLVNP